MDRACGHKDESAQGVFTHGEIAMGLDHKGAGKGLEMGEGETAGSKGLFDEGGVRVPFQPYRCVWLNARRRQRRAHT